jgi:hypothetical protein
MKRKDIQTIHLSVEKNQIEVNLQNIVKDLKMFLHKNSKMIKR